MASRSVPGRRSSIKTLLLSWRTVAERGDVVPLQVLHAAGSAGQDDNVRPFPCRTDMQGYILKRNSA